MPNITLPKTDIVGCKFPTVAGQRNQEITTSMDGKEYFYKLLPGTPTPRCGDLVVASCVNGLQVVVVTTPNAMTSFEGEYAMVIGLVDPVPYNTYLANKAKKAVLKRQLNEMKKQLDDDLMLELMAEKSPEFKTLLEMYKSLD